jgi:hypothetical protein
LQEAPEKEKLFRSLFEHPAPLQNKIKRITVLAAMTKSPDTNKLSCFEMSRGLSILAPFGRMRYQDYIVTATEEATKVYTALFWMAGK